jgi:hypothetical protein
MAAVAHHARGAAPAIGSEFGIGHSADLSMPTAATMRRVQTLQETQTMRGTRRAAAALAMALAGWAGPALAGEPAAITAEALRPGETIVLDGRLSHPAWQRAPVFDAFVEKFPVVGAQPSQPTRVQVLVDDRALYVGITALDSHPQHMRHTVVRHDGVNRTQDFVVVYIDAIGTRSSAQWFRVNSAGSTADGMHTASDDSEDFAPDFDWDAATARTPQGWTAVFRLPFASLRFTEGQQDWRIMVARRLPREQFRLFTSVTIPNDAASFIATLQPLAGVTLPEDHHFLSLRPGLTLRHRSAAGDNKADADVSLDVKWRPRAELVIDGTLNPDFSQVALDVPPLAGNSRFALFLAEKRPFFFESADLLRMPTDALYTRSFTQPRAGLRATWRGPEWAGTAFAIRDRGRGLVLLPSAYGTDVAAQPASDSVSLRARRDTGALAFGGIATTRHYADGRGDNSVVGPDLGWQLSPQWRLRGQWLHSRSTALPAAGELQRGAAVDGDRLRLRLLRQSGAGETTFGLDDISGGFRHDSGFVNQAGVRRFEAYHSVGWHGLGPLNEFYVNVDSYQVRDRANGAVVQTVVRPGLWLTAARNVEAWFNVYGLSELRTAPGSPLLRERYVNLGMAMTPATWFPLVDTSVDYGDLADTAAGPGVGGVPQGVVRRGGRFNFSAKLRPLRPLELEPSLNLAWLDDAGRQTYREAVQQWLAVWHFNARHNLRLIVQRSTLQRRAEPGVGAEDGLQRTDSLTYAFRHSAGTRVYVGATRTRSGRADVTKETEAFVKLELDADDVGRWLQ